jgi:acyl-CoA thioester hydrolase
MSKDGAVRKIVGETRLRVRYAETDQMGVVYYANYLVWFEVGRAELMRQRGLDYRQMEIEEDCLMAARYDEEMIVETTVTGVRGPVVRFSYRVLRAADGVLLCEGETVHVVVGRDMKRCAMPKKYAALLSAAVSHAAL